MAFPIATQGFTVYLCTSLPVDFVIFNASSLLTIPQICVWSRGPIAAMTHEAGCGLNKSLNWVCVC
jgi:hypothetical protein